MVAERVAPQGPVDLVGNHLFPGARLSHLVDRAVCCVAFTEVEGSPIQYQ